MSLLPEKFYLDDFFDDFVPMSRMPRNDMKCDIYIDFRISGACNKS